MYLRTRLDAKCHIPKAILPRVAKRWQNVSNVSNVSKTGLKEGLMKEKEMRRRAAVFRVVAELLKAAADGDRRAQAFIRGEPGAKEALLDPTLALVWPVNDAE